MKRPVDVWLKASVAGSIWAASEIVFGSFLHNLQIPFSGNILTAIGLIVLISINYTWRDRGLLWRSAVVCALMKTISPSAVIFGPMIAIVSQGFLLEFSTRLVGRTIAGYLLGSMLAMSWNLFQKIVNIIIFYGFDIVELYKSLVSIAEKQLSTQFQLTWVPIFILFAVYALAGLIAGFVAIHIGKASRSSKTESPTKPETGNPFITNTRPLLFSYSLPWLFLTLIFILSALFVLHTQSVFIWFPYTIVISLIWVIRYKRALKQLKKPYFWGSFAIITFLVAFVFGKLNPILSTTDALILGLQMNVRAMVMVLGFTVLGTELYNPNIISWFRNSRLKKLHFALELAFESLPIFMNALPDFKTFVRKPVSVIHGIIAYSEQRIAELRGKYGTSKVIFVTGKIHGGKTTFCKELLKRVKEKNISANGLITDKIFENEKLIGYDLTDISQNRTYPFLRFAHMGQQGTVFGRFTVIDEGLHAGLRIIERAIGSDSSFVIIDEIGRMELEGTGWHNALKNIHAANGKCFVITVRNEFLPAMKRLMNAGDCLVIDLSKFKDNDYSKAMEEIEKPCRN